MFLQHKTVKPDNTNNLGRKNTITPQMKSQRILKNANGGSILILEVRRAAGAGGFWAHLQNKMGEECGNGTEQTAD